MKIFLKQPIYLPNFNGGDKLIVDRGIHEAILHGEYAKIPGTYLRVHKSIFDILPETMTHLPYDICFRLRAPDQPTSSIDSIHSKPAEMKIFLKQPIMKVMNLYIGEKQISETIATDVNEFSTHETAFLNHTTGYIGAVENVRQTPNGIGFKLCDQEFEILQAECPEWLQNGTHIELDLIAGQIRLISATRAAADAYLAIHEKTPAPLPK